MARVVRKKCHLGSIRLKKNRDVQRNLRFVLADGNALLVSFQTLILVEIPARPERFAEVSPVRFDVLNSKTAVDFQ